LKLGEALLEYNFLETQLDLLRARLAREVDVGGPTTHLLEEMQRISGLVRDMEIAMSWTEQQVALAGVPLAAYKVRVKHLLDLADAFEMANAERADKLREAAHKDNRVFEAALWLVDLQVPVVSAPAKENSTKEVER
jgi:hypothetical protein